MLLEEIVQRPELELFLFWSTRPLVLISVLCTYVFAVFGDFSPSYELNGYILSSPLSPPSSSPPPPPSHHHHNHREMFAYMIAHMSMIRVDFIDF